MSKYDEAGLLRDILENIRDDTPRLIYADWLEDNNQPLRGEFIRVQIEMAKVGQVVFPDGKIGQRTGCEEDDNITWRLMRRSQQILDTSIPYQGRKGEVLLPASQVWSPNFIPWSNKSLRRFTRGFVSEIDLPLVTYLDKIKRLFSSYPLEEVIFLDREPRSFLNTLGGYGWQIDSCSSLDDLGRITRSARNQFNMGEGWRAHGSIIPHEFLPWFEEGNHFSFRMFSTLEEATKALSYAAVQLGRKVGGLPFQAPSKVALTS